MSDGPKPADAAQTLTVEKFVVTGSTVFSQAEFDRVTAPFVGRVITLTSPETNDSDRATSVRASDLGLRRR